jgi:hypothetical protein
MQQLQIDMSSMRSKFDGLDKQVQDNVKMTTTNIALSEQRCNKRIEQLQLTNQQNLNDLGTTFIEQMKINQQTTGEMIQNMLSDRDDSLIQKMNEQLQNIISSQNNTNTSPIRKTSSTQINYDDMQLYQTQDDNKENEEKIPVNTNYIPTTQKISNPYHPNSLRRRSVETTLPTTTP